MRVRIVVASSNPGKLREFREAAQARGIALESVPDFGSLPPCLEDGLSFEDNARKKALHYSTYTDGLVFADDSGISVDALDGAPGIRSARFAGPDANDEANNQELLTELRRVEAAGSVKIAPTARAAHALRTRSGLAHRFLVFQDPSTPVPKVL
jgi:XTP/dITP diphosphohydrolase